MKSMQVSVVIPTYNCAEYLRLALQSVRAQTVQDWEAIVVNNFSTDHTISVVESFHDPRIKLINFKNNGVIGAARNQGVINAKAPLIAFLDSDDTWEPTKLEVCLKAMDSSVDVVCHDEKIISQDGVLGRVHAGPEVEDQFSYLLFQKNCLSPSATIVRAKAIAAVGNWSEDPQMVTAEDYDFWLKLAKNKVKFHFINEILGSYRIHAMNSINAMSRHRRATIEVLSANFRKIENPTIKHWLLFIKRYSLIYLSAVKAAIKRMLKGNK